MPRKIKIVLLISIAYARIHHAVLEIFLCADLVIVEFGINLVITENFGSERKCSYVDLLLTYPSENNGGCCLDIRVLKIYAGTRTQRECA
jgi:hypothetical protein